MFVKIDKNFKKFKYQSIQCKNIRILFEISVNMKCYLYLNKGRYYLHLIPSKQNFVIRTFSKYSVLVLGT